MTTDFMDPHNDDDEEFLDDELTPPSEESSEPEPDELETEPTMDHDSSAIAPKAADQLPFDAVAPTIDIDQFWRDSIRKGNEALESAFRERQPAALPNPSESHPDSPQVLGPTPIPLARPGDNDPQELPATRRDDGRAIEQYSTTQPTSPEPLPEVPPVVVHHLPPRPASSEASDSKENRQRLRIEVEITLANAERISHIAVEEAKAEFKKLASQATQRLDEKFYEYRMSQRLLQRR